MSPTDGELARAAGGTYDMRILSLPPGGGVRAEEAEMQVIDCDAHIDETEATWDFLGQDALAYKPTTGYPANPDPIRPPTRYWLIDGHRQPRLHRDDRRSQTTVETRELLDPMARVRHMDELGTDIQVIYPTMFLVGVTDSAGPEVAVKRSYNRW